MMFFVVFEVVLDEWEYFESISQNEKEEDENEEFDNDDNPEIAVVGR